MRPGGSCALGELIDEHGEAIFTDLLVHYGFDLVRWLAREVPGSPETILAMLRNLPEGSRYTAIMSAPSGGDEPEPPPLDPEVEGMLERKLWTTDRKLLAQLINAVNTNTRYAADWEKGKEPDFPIVGPAAWSGDSNKQTSPPPASPKTGGQLTVDGIFNKMMGR